jgi:ethanolamine utilization protein EutL
MAVLDPISARVLAARLIPNTAGGLAEALKLRPEQRSIGLITADSDHALYVAVDDATKMADVQVVYAHSFYAGSRVPSGALSGEVIAILAGPYPEEVSAGLNAARQYLTSRALWYSANAGDSVTFFPHVISQSGGYLSKLCGIPYGSAIAYLVAPPLEGVFAMDAALKAAAVQVVSYTPPPSETNFMRVILTGDQASCRAAAAAFQQTVLDVAARPVEY